MSTLLQDLRYALHTLSKSRGFAFIAIITLALGIGVSTAIFSVMDNVLMERFPYKDAKRLMFLQIHDQDKRDPGRRTGFSSAEFVAHSQQNHLFDQVIGAGDEAIVNLIRGGPFVELDDNGNPISEG